MWTWRCPVCIGQLSKQPVQTARGDSGRWRRGRQDVEPLGRKYPAGAFAVIAPGVVSAA